MAKLGGVTPLLCCRRSCVGRHPEPFLGGREHLLEARVIANRIDIRIDFDVAHVRAAVEPLEEWLKRFEGFVDRTDLLDEHAAEIVAHDVVIRIEEQRATYPLQRPVLVAKDRERIGAGGERAAVRGFLGDRLFRAIEADPRRLAQLRFVAVER